MGIWGAATFKTSCASLLTRGQGLPFKSSVTEEQEHFPFLLRLELAHVGEYRSGAERYRSVKYFPFFETFFLRENFYIHFNSSVQIYAAFFFTATCKLFN